MSKKKPVYKPKKPVEPKTKPVDPFFKVVASVYGVPETGIDAIDNQPYLNKDGRLYLLNELRKDEKGVKAIRVEFIKYSTNLNETSVVKKIIEFKNDILVEAIGEASQDNVETKGVKTTLNMVAETRALNRAIWVAIAGDVMTRVEGNLEKLEISEADKARLLEAGRVSYEEMERPDTGKTDAKASSMYESTAKRVDEISKDEAKLRAALSKVEQLPLQAEHKTLIKQRIEGALRKFVKEPVDNTPTIQMDADVPRETPKKKPTAKKPTAKKAKVGSKLAPKKKAKK